MPIQKIIANNSSEGLKRISDELGDDALILKTIKRNGRIEFFVEVAEAEVSPEPEVSLSVPQPEPDRRIKEQYREARLKMLSARADQADRPESDQDDLASYTSAKPIRKIQSELTVNTLLDSLGLTPGVAARLRECKRIDEVTGNLALMVSTETALSDGIYAFVGPAGGGKTTSLMKVVVKHIMEHGENSCAIINCDRYSVGAIDRIQRFGELTGVDVIQVGPDRNLNEAIAAVAKRRLVAIDTPGLSPKSVDLLEQLQSINRSHYEISRLLVLPANLQYASMQMARKLYAGKRLSSCIATRMDEVPSCGALLSFLAQSELPLRYLGTGPQIPDDLEVANVPELIHLSLSLMDQEFAKAGISDLTKEKMDKNAKRSVQTRRARAAVSGRTDRAVEKVMDL
jgi:flagellar biosynthesis GTPase FlhF